MLKCLLIGTFDLSLPIKSIIVTAYVDVSSTAIWAQNATTAAGQGNGVSGTLTDYLDAPCGITISIDDILYIADSHNNRVVVVNLTSSIAVVSTIGSYGSGISQFNRTNDVCIIEKFIYVLDTFNYRIQKWSTNGTNPSTVPGAGSFNVSDYMFIDKYGNLYMSVVTNSTVIRFAPNSSVPVTIAGNGTAGFQSNQLNNPYGIYIDENLTMYVADHNNNRIQMWTYGASFGKTVAGNGTSGANLTQLSNPTAVVVDINGFMYIADSGNNRIIQWPLNSTSGICIAACTGTRGNLTNQINKPNGLAFDSNGSLYVSDFLNNRVQKFQILNNQKQMISTSQTTSKPTMLTSHHSSTGETITTTHMSIPTFKSGGTSINKISTIVLSTSTLSTNIATALQRATTVSQRVINASPDITTMSKQTTIGSEQTVAASQQATVVSQQATVVSQQATVVSQQATVVSQQATVVSQRTTTASQKTAILPQRVTSTSQQNTTVSKNTTILPDQTATTLQHNSTVSQLILNASQTIATESQYTTTMSKQTTIGSEQTVAASQQAAAGSQRITTASQKTSILPQRVTSTSQQNTNLSKNTTTLPDRTATTLQHNSIVSQQILNASQTIATESQYTTTMLKQTTTESEHTTTVSQQITFVLQRVTTVSQRTVQQRSHSFVPPTCPNTVNIGFNCNISDSPCDTLKPCQSSGTCYTNDATDYGYICMCPPGFNGTQCEFDHRPCQPNTCWNDGLCNETLDSTFDCSCKLGWQGDHCEAKINYCSNVTCMNNGVCRPLFLNFTCECLGDSYYSGRYCEISATKIIIYTVVSKSCASVAIIAMISAVMFIIIMDILKYFFKINPAPRKLKQISRKEQVTKPKLVIIRYMYVNALPVPPPSEEPVSIIQETAV